MATDCFCRVDNLINKPWSDPYYSAIPHGELKWSNKTRQFQRQIQIYKIYNVSRGGDDECPLLHGWRYTMAGKELVGLLKGELLLGIDSDRLAIIEK